jgi:signal transduction histidine kinase
MPGKEQSMIQLIVVGTILLLLVGGFVISFLFFYSKRQKKHQMEKIDMHHSFQQELLRTQLEIQEQTLKNIGLEIHDNIGQTLSLVKLNLNTIDVEKQQGMQEKIYNSKELVSKAIHDLRSLSKTLNTEAILSSGLIRAVEYELQIIEKAGVFKTALTVSGNPVKLDPRKELILFRIVQEALNNIIKHSGAQNIRLEMVFEEHGFALSIEDDGAGFQALPAQDTTRGGSGLGNMRNRAALIGADFSLQSNLQSGTRIRLTIPTTES